MRDSDGQPRPPSRRQLLAAVGSGAALGTAGCSGILGGDGDPGADSTEEGGPPDDGEWERTFADDFSTGELDRSVWQHGFGSNPLDCPDHEGPNHCAVPDHAAVEDGRLVLEASEATPEIPPEEDWDDRDTRPEYSVGAVHTEGAFEQEFGYFEAKSRIPADPGTLPACWFYVDISEHSWREPHVYEARGADGGESVEMGALWWETEWEFQTAGANGPEDSTVPVDPPTDETFHVYGVEWGPESLAWYVDGERVGRSTHPGIAEHLAGEPVYWILNHGVFEAAEWVGDPAETEFPSLHEFEWVRAWQREDWMSSE